MLITEAQIKFIQECRADGVVINEKMYLDRDTMRDWVKACAPGEADMGSFLVGGIQNTKKPANLNRLLEQVIDGISADNLIAFRDEIEAVLFAGVRADIMEIAADVSVEEIEQIESTGNKMYGLAEYVRDHGVHLQGDPLTGGR